MNSKWRLVLALAVGAAIGLFPYVLGFLVNKFMGTPARAEVPKPFNPPPCEYIDTAPMDINGNPYKDQGITGQYWRAYPKGCRIYLNKAL